MLIKNVLFYKNADNMKQKYYKVSWKQNEIMSSNS